MIAGARTRAPSALPDLLPPELGARLERLDVLSRKVFAGKLQGERRSKKRGRSVEFDDYREYVAGDDLRHIDWNVFARLDRFFIKLFQEEEDLSLHVVVDASASMHAGVPSKVLFAGRLAMALCYIGLLRNNRVHAAVFGGPTGALRRLSAVRGRRNVRRVFGFLTEELFAPTQTGGGGAGGEGAVRGGAEGVFGGALRTLAAARSGQGVMVVISDLLIPGAEGYRAGLRYLVGGGGSGDGGPGLDATVVQVLSPGEIDPGRDVVREAGVGVGGAAEQPGEDAEPRLLGDLRLEDCETGRAAEVTVTREVLARYAAASKRYVEGVEGYCAARGIRHVLAPSNADVGELVLGALRRRGVVG